MTSGNLPIENDPQATRKECNESPCTNFWDRFENLGLFRAARAVTRPSRMALEGDTQRPMSLRKVRADLYRLFQKKAGRIGREKILHEAKLRDEIATQFLTQGTVRVTLREGGEVASRFTDMKPPPETLQQGKPPVVFIPGICNDLDSVDLLAQEITYSGRRVVTIAYPDSWMGEVSPEFASAVEHAEGFQPHAAFFRDAIRQLVPDGDIELWAFSTGAPIVADMLSRDTELSARMEECVLVNPAGTGKQSMTGLRVGLAVEVGNWLADFRNLPALNTANGRKPAVEQEMKGQRELKERIFKALLSRIRRPTNWSAMKTREGSRIFVLSGTGDKVTSCNTVFNEGTTPPHPAMTVRDMPGRHAEPLKSPAHTVQAIDLFRSLM